MISITCMANNHTSTYIFCFTYKCEQVQRGKQYFLESKVSSHSFSFKTKVLQVMGNVVYVSKTSTYRILLFSENVIKTLQQDRSGIGLSFTARIWSLLIERGLV